MEKDHERAIRQSKKRYENKEIESMLENTYIKNEVIIFFPKTPSDNDIKEVETTLEKEGFKIERKLKCDKCDIPIELWQGDNLHTILQNQEGIEPGAGPTKTDNVGERYSLNFKNIIPYKGENIFLPKAGQIDTKKQKIVVAVLDTGVDTSLVDPAYLWDGSQGALDTNCYLDINTGWNFTWEGSTANRIGNSDYHDDNEGKHGSLVSQYIINQFKDSTDNRVEIML